MKLKPIQNQVVVVVGASSGIGRETALRFGRRGASVVVAARREEPLRLLCEEIRAAGGQAVHVTADVSDAAQVRAIAEAADAAFGRIDTWVQAAGVGLWADMEHTPPEEWKRVIDVNLNGQAYAAMAALPFLKHAGGAFISVSSVEARVPMPLQGAYAASKHGVHAFLKTLRMELKHDDVPVSVTEIMPSGINTPLFDTAQQHLGTVPRPLGPMYQPEIAADAILYAAEHAVEELVIGGTGQAAILAQTWTPRLLEKALVAVGWKLQRTDRPKLPGDASNLFAPLDAHETSRGTFSARRTSLYTWAETHPGTVRALSAVAAGTALVMIGIHRKGRHSP